MRVDPYDMTMWCFDHLDDTEHLPIGMLWILAALGCMMLAYGMLAVWVVLAPLVWVVTLGRVRWVPKWMSG